MRDAGVHQPERNRTRLLRRWDFWLSVFVALIALVAASVVVASRYHVPYYAISPGKAVPVTGQITVPAGRAHPIDGEIDLVYVMETPLTALTYVWYKFAPNTQIIPDNEVASTPTGSLSNAQVVAEDRWYQAQSQPLAAVAALNALGYHVKERATGVLVGWVDPTAPAAAGLLPGDIITSFAGTPTPTIEALAKREATLHPGDTVAVTFHPPSGRSGTRTFRLASQPGGGATKDPYLGIGLIPRYTMPFPVSISDEVNGQAIGGPSAGLAYALDIVDSLSGGDLTHGMHIAATGEIGDPEGDVVPIGGLPQKAVAARNAGATVFFVPAGQSKSDYAGACAAAGPNLKIVEVSSLAKAVAILKSGRLSAYACRS